MVCFCMLRRESHTLTKCGLPCAALVKCECSGTARGLHWKYTEHMGGYPRGSEGRARVTCRLAHFLPDSSFAGLNTSVFLPVKWEQQALLPHWAVGSTTVPDHA